MVCSEGYHWFQAVEPSSVGHVVLPAGTFTGNGDADLAYRLQAEPQPLFIDGTLTVQVTPPTGWRPVKQSGMKTEGGTATVSAVQNAPVNVLIEFERP